MPKRRVALIVDHPQRDLAGMVLTARELCRRDFVCHLVPLNLQGEEIMSLAPDFVLLNYMRAFNFQLAQRLREVGIPFGMIDTEGGVWEDFSSYAELLWRDRELLHEVKPACIWGEAMEGYLRSEGLLRPNQMRITGCPRFDFYNPRWRSVLDEKDDGPSRKTILVNANFSVVNPRFTTPESNRRYCHEEYGWSYEEIDTVTSKETRAIQDTIEITRDLRQRFPDVRIILRPHPFESAEPYVKGLEGLDYELNHDGPVQPKICSADVVIQRSCTTAIEAGAAGVPTLSPQWMPAPYLMPMAEDVSRPCENASEMRACVADILDNSYQPDQELRNRIETTVERFFHRIDGLSHQRVSDGIEAALETPTKVDRRLCRHYAYALDDREKTIREKASIALKRSLGLSPDWSFRRMKAMGAAVWKGTAKEIKVGDVERLIHRIEKADEVEVRKNGHGRNAIRVASAASRGDFLGGYSGGSVTLWKEGSAS